MRVQAFDWDTWNIGHVARHGLESHEVEAACRGEDVVILRGREGRYLLYGRTGAGRYLLVVVRAVRGGTVRVITARDMTEREQRFYRRRR